MVTSEFGSRTDPITGVKAGHSGLDLGANKGTAIRAAAAGAVHTVSYHLTIDPGNGIYHCLLVLGENQPDGVLIEAEGYDYARYSSYFPSARDYLNARLHELTEHLIRDSTQNTSNGSWMIYFNEIKTQYGVNLEDSGCISTMLCESLAARPEMAEIELMEDGFDMTLYLDYCPNLEDAPGKSEEIRLKELIRVPFENLNLVHHEVDMELSTIVYLDSATLTEEGKQAWADVLNAQVLRVFHGIYGLQAECAGVPCQRLTEFSRMLAGYCPCEDYDRWVKNEPDTSELTMKF